MSSLDVFKTEPVFIPKVWGGRKLADVFGKSLPDERPYGESWEVADLPEGQSLAAGGPHQGATLRELADEFGVDLVGTGSEDGRFPLLVKLLDAARDLSVQVHPGPDQLDGRPGAHSKDESWLILDADPDASILHGLTREVSAEVFRDATERGAVLRLLNRIPVTPGDVFRVPPGTIHAICAGVALLEIQQPSDTTYRVYDYDRPGLDGNPRDLHLDDAVEVARFGPTLPNDRGLDRSTGIVADGVDVLVNVDAYRIERLRADDDLVWTISPHTPQVVHLLSGSCCLNDLRLGPSETAVIPAATGHVFLTRPENCELVVAGLGGPPLISPDQ